MKFLLFGIGDYYERYKKWFDAEEIVALIDNSKKKQNTKIDGISVLSPENGVKLQYDAIVILSFYVATMKEQLLNLGISEQNIFHFYDMNTLLGSKRKDKKVKFYGGAEFIINNKQENLKKIALLSQELTLGGPSIALYHVAMVLKKKGYEVVYASMIDGPLREKLISNNIPVVIDENMQVGTMNDIEWLNGFSLIICNTINYHIFLTERDENIPILWWLHDALFFYDGVKRKNLIKIKQKNLKVISVGPIPRKAIQKFLPNLSVGELLYGVADNFIEKKYKKVLDKMCFVTIGFLENIKGQDILLKAISLLTDEVKKKIKVLLIGYDATLFAEQLKEQYQFLNEVQFVGSVDRQMVHNILDDADVLICPSRQDSMPTVVAEAMMHSIPCIVSDVIGTVEYICNGKNGIITPNENVDVLAEKIAWCVDHPLEVKRMGMEARILYENYFSMKKFEENLLETIKEFI